MTPLSFSTSATVREVLLLVGKAISCSLVEVHRPHQRLPRLPLPRRPPPRLQQQPRQPLRQQPRRRPQPLHRRLRQLLQLHQGPLQVRDPISHQGPVLPHRRVRNVLAPTARINASLGQRPRYSACQKISAESAFHPQIVGSRLQRAGRVIRLNTWGVAPGWFLR